MKTITASKATILAALLATLLAASTCRADDYIDAVAISSSENRYVGADSMSLLHKLASVGVAQKAQAKSPSNVLNATEDRTSRQTPALIPELISRLPVSRLFDAGAKALNIARYWPAGLASLVVGAAPTTGAVVGVVAIAIFIIVIWLVIYSIGVLPVGAALLGRDDYYHGAPYPYARPGGMMPYPGQGYAAEPYPGQGYGYPYNRYKRGLEDASRNVMEAINQFESKKENNI